MSSMYCSRVRIGVGATGTTGTGVEVLGVEVLRRVKLISLFWTL